MSDKEKPVVNGNKPLCSAYAREGDTAAKYKQAPREKCIVEPQKLTRDKPKEGRYSRHGLKPGEHNPV